MRTLKTPGSLSHDVVCIHKPESNWYDLREAINEIIRRERDEARDEAAEPVEA